MRSSIAALTSTLLLPLCTLVRSTAAMRLLVAHCSRLPGPLRDYRVPAVLPSPPRRPAQRCWSSHSGLGSAAGSSDSDSEGSPAAAAAELARVRRRQADLDERRAALDGQLESLEERQEALFEEEDALLGREDAPVGEELALVERERQLAEQLEFLEECREALFAEEEALAEQERQLQSLLGSQEGAGGSMDAGGSLSVDAGGWTADGSGVSTDGVGAEERQEWGTASQERSDEDGWGPHCDDIPPTKWSLDGCRTLAECRQRLRCAGQGAWGWLGRTAMQRSTAATHCSLEATFSKHTRRSAKHVPLSAAGSRLRGWSGWNSRVGSCISPCKTTTAGCGVSCRLRAAGTKGSEQCCGGRAPAGLGPLTCVVLCCAGACEPVLILVPLWCLLCKAS